MTAHVPEAAPPERPAVEAVAGLLAAAAIVVGFVAMAYEPAKLAPAAIVMALTASAMTRRWARLAAVAVAVGGLGWLIGMTIAVITDNPIY